MPEYAFDCVCAVAIRVPDQPDEATAREVLLSTLDCADTNFGQWPNGDPALGEVSVAYDLMEPVVYAVDGEETGKGGFAPDNDSLTYRRLLVNLLQTMDPPAEPKALAAWLAAREAV